MSYQDAALADINIDDLPAIYLDNRDNHYKLAVEMSDATQWLFIFIYITDLSSVFYLLSVFLTTDIASRLNKNWAFILIQVKTHF